MMYLNHNDKHSTQLEFLLQLQISITIIDFQHNDEKNLFNHFSSQFQISTLASLSPN